MIKELKSEIQSYVNKRLNEIYSLEFNTVIENPKNPQLGDLAIPSFSLCKVLKKSPVECAEVIKNILLELDYFSSVECVGAYVNAKYSRTHLAEKVFKNLSFERSESNGKTVCIDYSSPNIAKPFSIGHLRSTIIGQSLGNVLEYKGYKVVRIDHLGDFGTQFGKLIWAFKNWGNMDDVLKDPINTLVGLYVRFNQEAEKNPALDDEARKIFKELEEGNAEYRELWNTFKNYSLKEFMRMYELLNVHFDKFSSEAEASRKSSYIIGELKKKGLLVEDQGAQVVFLSDPLPPAIIQKSDGSTLYITRDLEEVWDRYNEFKFDKMLYCVGNEQKLYFNQVKEVLAKMDAPFASGVSHVAFGLILRDGKKMSTRTGTAVKLEDVLNESIRLAKAHIDEKNPNLEGKDEIATKIGVSAIIFNDLKNFRENEYEFDLESATRFEGQTGPYIEYTSVRIGSILESANFDPSKVDYSLYENEIMFEIVKKIDEFSDVLDKVVEEYAPHYLAKYLLQLSTLFNSFYAKERVLTNDDVERNTKLNLLKGIKNTIDKGLTLLNMSVLEKM